MDPTVINFLESLSKSLTEGDAIGLRNLYEVTFNAITESQLKESQWPDPSAAKTFFADPHFFCLYQEIFWRHMYARHSADLQWHSRVQSGENYSALFDFFISQVCADKKDLPLPLTWQWDIMDELVYQYQENQRYRLSNPEIIKQSTDCWQAPTVVLMLQKVADKSGVKQTLQSNNNNSEELTLGQTLGYFALISLIRLLTSMGDYGGALEVAGSLKLGPRELYCRVPAAHLTLIHNLAFCYLMTRRYDDGARILVQLLSFLAHNQSYLQTAGYQQDPMLRTVERMYHILFVCESLSPPSASYARSDDAVASHLRHLREKQLSRLDPEDAQVEAFMKGCPKFIDPIVEQQDHHPFDSNEATKKQLAVFRRAAKAYSAAVDVHSVARLYNNLTLSKLALLVGIKDADAVQPEMLAVKHRAVQTIWKTGMPLDQGVKTLLLSDLELHLEGEMIHVTSREPPTNCVDTLIRQIVKTCDPLKPAGRNNKGDDLRI